MARLFITSFQQVSGFPRDVNILSVRRPGGIADKTVGLRPELIKALAVVI